MCRNIRPLANFEPPAASDEIQAAALQYVRKISGMNKPAKANQEVFDRAAAVAIALDRMEKGTGELSAVQEVEKQYGLPVVAIANLNDLFTLLQNNAEFGGFLEPVRAYRERYGVA